MSNTFRCTALNKANGVYAIVPAYGVGNAIGPCQTVGNPADGDECLVILDDKVRPWLVTTSVIGASEPAGGVLSGTYPNPGFAVDMATQAELDAVSASLPTAVTSLPGSPTNGQEIIYSFTQSVNPVDALPIYWRLKYSLTDAAWYPIGEPAPIFAYQGANESTVFSANTWGGVSTNDPRLNFPLAGDYRLEWGAGIFWVNAAGNWYLTAYSTGAEQTTNPTQPSGDAATGEAGSTLSGMSGVKKWTQSAAAQSGSQGVRQRIFVTVGGTVSRGAAYLKAYPRKIPG